ncbi:hypothetical protein [Emcibacter nanhaiensis]|uniref:Uncharacterized protein n=1 Tax=Emcibacter nanhaiensis TaxID=1505037 RepID=A0A501PBQ9_9PROT|nr:hypothetical protein [Emcibacter nanhaiensis]TPD57442.1 hypothetical protein FIV46_15080 [Emcibacter nanhaiensis]
MKKEARLTGSLLARKGKAIPSPAAPKFSMPAINRFGHKGQDDTVDEKHVAAEAEDGLANTIETVKKLSEVQGRRSGPSDDKTETTGGKIFGRRKVEKTAPKAPKAAGKRIAMTLRMTEEDHLKLRLYSAHTRKSCQEVLTEALDMYLCNESEHVCDNKRCSCLAE